MDKIAHSEFLHVTRLELLELLFTQYPKVKYLKHRGALDSETSRNSEIYGGLLRKSRIREQLLANSSKTADFSFSRFSE